MKNVPQKITRAQIRGFAGRMFLDCSPASVADISGKVRPVVKIQVKTRMGFPLISRAAVKLAKLGCASGVVFREKAKAGSAGAKVWLKDQSGQVHLLKEVAASKTKLIATKPTSAAKKGKLRKKKIRAKIRALRAKLG